MNTATPIEREVKEAIEEASPWVEWLTRLGYFAKGALYIVVGMLALQVAENAGGQAPGTKDALQAIKAQPFGQILVGLIILGLLGYSVWLFMRAILDIEKVGTGLKGITRRIGFAARAVGPLVLVFVAFQLLNGSGGGSENSAASWTAWVMQAPLGRWLVGLVGASFVGVGLSRFYLAYSTEFQKHLDFSEMSELEQKTIIWAGRIGIVSYGIVLVMIGSFLIQAAVQYQPSEARGLSGTLQTILQQPYGPWLLGLMALGFMANGVYMILRGRFRRIEVSA